jgi:hypothetical protein
MVYRIKKKRVLKPKSPKRKPNLWERIKIYKFQAQGKTSHEIATLLQFDPQCMAHFLRDYSLRWIHRGMKNWEMVAVGKKLLDDPEALDAYYRDLELLKGYARGTKIYFQATVHFESR